MTNKFTQAHFDLLNAWKHEKKNKDEVNTEYQNAVKLLKQPNELTKIWGEKVLKGLSNGGHLGYFSVSPIDQAGKFKPYTWVKIYPLESAEQLAFTVGIDASYGFVTKIDTVGVDDKSEIRREYEKIRGNFNNNSQIIAMLSIEEGVSKSLDELAEWSLESIKKFQPTYDKLCSKLNLSYSATLKEIYDYLKERYENSSKEFHKIFLINNKIDKELVLNLIGEKLDYTRTIEIFLKDDPKLIIPPEQYEFINTDTKIEAKTKAKAGLYSKLKTHTNILKKSEGYFKISILNIDQIKKVCDWYESEQTLVNSNTDKIKVDSMNSNKLAQPLNRILFGPAGTGKTHCTINHALSIIENKSIEKILEEEKLDNGNGREEINKRFKALKKDGRINFVTFHQSFSYEDFVEGIRAETRQEIDDEGKVVSFLDYPVVSGVFKQVCEKAVTNDYAEKDIDQLIQDFAQEVLKKELTLDTKTGVRFTVLSSSGKDIKVRTSTSNEIQISKSAIKLYLLEPSKNIRDNQAYAWSIANCLSERLSKSMPIQEHKPYILIIDEINRGNISRIFGELITLIEDSKREGASESLSVTLPYSGKEFSVPNNVYIIGTMNSSDRSLTGLDLALRRRFTFVEMQPDTSLLKGIKIGDLNVGALLEVMNQRIEVLLDRDHCIGHAYFMTLTGPGEATVENLKAIFLQQIVPLLQEYFFDDWSKINLVLNGNGMLNSKGIQAGLFKPGGSDEASYLQDKKIWRLNINESVFDKIETYKNILIQGTDRVTSDDSQHAPE